MPTRFHKKNPYRDSHRERERERHTHTRTETETFHRTHRCLNLSAFSSTLPHTPFTLFLSLSLSLSNLSSKPKLKLNPRCWSSKPSPPLIFSLRSLTRLDFFFEILHSWVFDRCTRRFTRCHWTVATPTFKGARSTAPISPATPAWS